MGVAMKTAKGLKEEKKVVKKEKKVVNKTCPGNHCSFDNDPSTK